MNTRMLPLANSPNDMRVLGGEESKWWLVPLDEPDGVTSTLPGVQKHCDIQTTGPMGGTQPGAQNPRSRQSRAIHCKKTPWKNKQSERYIYVREQETSKYFFQVSLCTKVHCITLFTFIDFESKFSAESLTHTFT